MPDITIQTGDGDFSAYLAVPAGGSGPGIIAIQEIFGVNADMRAHCDNFAAQGFVALSPDLFWRQEPGVQITDQTEAEWQQAIDTFTGKIDADQRLQVRFSYQVNVRNDGSGRVHVG